MGERSITFCDGCEKILEKNCEKYYLRLETARFFDGHEYDTMLKTLVFCDKCSDEIKSTLENIARRLNQ